MTIHDQIISALEDCPTARDMAAIAKVYADLNDGPGVAIHVSLAADILVQNHPELGDSIEVARILAAGIFAIPQHTARMDALN
jgi:hypothetical protein